ncbi:MAG: GNAT family N-acetyltransferase [Archangium sp.]|nr:GNAT family N-acetyltransferase [Archangium sp.]
MEVDGALLRPLRESDVDSITRHANDRDVWRNLRDAFPHPYGPDDARKFLAMQAEPSSTARVFGIDVGGTIVGACGLHPQPDVYARSAEIGYWLGSAFHGRGLMTKVVRAVTEFGFGHEWMERIYASVFEWNPASMRVLEKCGYVREGVLRKSVFKDGQLIDAALYARVR